MSYDYGTVMAEGRPDCWNDVLASIDRHDVYAGDDGTYGLENEPHVTVLYGLLPEVHPDLVCRICDAFDGPIEVSLEGVSAFTDSDDYDVLKVDVESEKLRELNKVLRNLPYESEYTEYNPHMTIAYLKSGCAQKYMDLEDQFCDTMSFDSLTFKPPVEEETRYRLPLIRR